MPCASFSMLDGPGGTAPRPSSFENNVHGIEKLPLKNSSKLSKFLYNEVNLPIQHIIVQDQDGQNNNKLISKYKVIICVLKTSSFSPTFESRSRFEFFS